jgi:hypothetical protein
MISDEQRKYIEKLYEASSWHGQSPYTGHPIRHFGLGSIYLHSWRHHRIWRTLSTPPATGMILRAGDKPYDITSAVSIMLWECSDVQNAHDQLLDILAEMQSNTVKRNRQREIGDVLFTLADTMFVFARANLVVLIRNAGANVLSLGELASSIDFAIMRNLQKSQAAVT